MQIAPPDSEAIRQVVSDYYEGWYHPDVGKMDRSLHPRLAKRSVRRDEQGTESLHQLTKDIMLEKARQGGGAHALPGGDTWEMTVLDQYEEIATVKVVSGEYVEYLHLARQDGRWLIVNALFTGLRTENPG